MGMTDYAPEACFRPCGGGLAINHPQRDSIFNVKQHSNRKALGVKKGDRCPHTIDMFTGQADVEQKNKKIIKKTT